MTQITPDFTQKKVVLYTTNYGNYNKNFLPVPPQTIPVDCYYLTDDPHIQNPYPSWKIISTLYPRHDLNPRMRAKFFKLMPWEHEILSQYDYWIYVDSCVKIKRPDFCEWLLSELKDQKIALTPHQFRNNIADEGIACILARDKAGRFTEENLIENQMYEYLGKFHQSRAPKMGLWWCGIIVRKNTKAIKQLGREWFLECIKWSARDQLSFPVVRERLDITVSPISWKQLHPQTMSTEWFDWCPEYSEKRDPSLFESVPALPESVIGKN